MRRGIAAIALLVVTGAAMAQTPPPAPTSPAPADAASVDAILAALYAGVSHPPNVPPDWSKLRSICAKEARFIPPRRANGELAFLSTEEFITRVSDGIAARAAKKEDTGFVEREIARKTDCWGDICQVFSTYEGRHTATDAKPFVRGINSIQLSKDGSRWWIVNVFWDSETPAKSLSAPYLPTTTGR